MAVDASRLYNGIRRFAENTMDAVGPITAANMRADPRVPIGTSNTAGELRGSITSTGGATNLGTTYRASVVAPVVQARTTDKGAREHPIRPTRGKVLTWVGPGGRVFARHVNHPGNPARPWFADVLRDAYIDALRQAARAAA